MLTVIAETLRQKLDLPFIERTAGLVSALRCAKYAKNGIQPGHETLMIEGWNGQPVGACDEDTFWKALTPDASKKGLSFFVDNGGVSFVQVAGTKQGIMEFNFSLKLLVWFNSSMLMQPENSGLLTAYAAPYIIEKLYGAHEIPALPIPEMAGMYRGMVVDKITQLSKTPDNWLPFEFAKNPALFAHPYDHMAFSLSGRFVIYRKCLPAIIEMTGQNCKPI